MRIAFRHHRTPPLPPPPLQSAQIPGNRHTPMDIPGYCPLPPANYKNFTKPAQNKTVKNTVHLFIKKWQCPYLESLQNNNEYTTSNICFRQVHIKQTNWRHGKTFLLILRLLSFQLASMSGLWRIHNEIIHLISKMFIPRWLQQHPILLLPMLLMHIFTGKVCHRFSGQPWESSETPFPNQHIMGPYKSPINRTTSHIWCLLWTWNGLEHFKRFTVFPSDWNHWVPSY